jgi:hypothetical protein
LARSRHTDVDALSTGPPSARPPGRWRAEPRQASRSRRVGRLVKGLGLLAIAIIGAAVVVGILVAPLFRWQTAAVTLLIDQYELGTIEPVPYGSEDRAALVTALAGHLGTKLGTDVLDLTGLESAAGLRELLLPRMLRLDLRPKDVMIAYVRSQAIVVPPSPGADPGSRTDPIAGRACFLASDLSVAGTRPREVVPIRDVVEAIGAAPPYTTLHVLDLGDVAWEPRLGVLGNVVSRVLDVDFAHPQRDASHHNWVLGSHDLFQHSAVTTAGGRTYFSRAVELALAGSADERPWGDGDGLVELHEVVPFVKAWTAEWVRQTSGGRSVQTPVLWKLGVGRIATSDIPRDVPLIRLARARPTKAISSATPSAPGTAKEPPAGPPEPAAPDEPRQVAPPPDAKPAAGAKPTMTGVRQTAAAEAASPGPASAENRTGQQQAPTAPGAQGSTEPGAKAAASTPPAADAAAPQATDGTAAPADTPTTNEPLPEPVKRPDQPRPPADAWEALDRFADRRHRTPAGGPTTVFSAGPGPVVVDFAPHIWSRLFALVASADSRRRGTGPLAERAEVAFQKLGQDLAALWAAWSTGSGATAVRAATAPTIKLQAALERVEDDAFASRWAAAPASFTQALAARNDAIVVLRSIIAVSGKINGGAAAPPIDPTRVATLLDKVNVLTSLIRRTSQTDAATGAVGLDPLSSATRSLVSETTVTTELLRGVIRSLVPDQGTRSESRGFEGWVAALASPAIGTDVRTRIRQRLQGLHEARSSAHAANPAEGGPDPFDGLPQATGPLPVVVELDEAIDRTNLEFIAGRVLAIAGLAEASIAGGFANEPDSRNLTGDIAAVRRAAADLPRTTPDRKEAIAQIVALGGLVAHLEARVAVVLGTLRNKDGTPSRTLDDVGASLLRVLDSRDVAAIDRPIVAGIPDWTPRTTTMLTFDVRGDARRLSLTTPLEGRIVLPGNDPPPPDATVRLTFDPADIRVVLDGDREARPGEPMRASNLPFAGPALGLRILANRGRTANERATIALGISVESATLSAMRDVELERPARRDIALGVRRVPREPGMDASRYRFATRADPPNRPAGRETSAERFEVDLVAVPGASTAWEVAIENRADIPRTFTARLFSLPVLDPINSQSGRTRAAVWSDFCDAFEAGSVLPEPVATIEKLSLAAQSDATVVTFPPPAPKAELPPPQPAAGATPPAAPGPRPIGPDFAIMLEETTPGEPKRAFFVRLKLSVEHPRQRLRASATWSRDERVVSVRVEPAAASGVEGLPPEGLRVALEPLPSAPLTAPQPLGVRRGATVLTRSRPTDVLTATWQGSDADARAWLAVSVNGYPRAFVFIVDCSAAADGIAQEPQDDFRAITFGGPRPAVPPAIKAPADAIPITLLVDAPPDSAPPGDGGAAIAATQPVEAIVSLAFRAVRAGGMMAEGTQTVWTAVGDRQVTYTAEPPKGSAAIAVRADVADWSIAPTGEGYVDLDLVAEARLAAPGMAAAIKDTRTFVMDGRPPKVEVPPLMNATVGRRLTVPVMAVDDPRESFATAPGTHIPGVSGVARVEWALDLKGDGAPEAWAPAVGLGGGSYEIRLDTQPLPPGARLPLLVRATDRVGLAHPPSRVWIDTSVAVAKGQINGKVVLQNRGERNVLVRIDGPNAPPPQRSGADGVFTFRDLDPGTYTLKATGPVRNRSYSSEATPAVVAAPPAPAPNVTLELK